MRAETKPEISIVLPVYNEEGNIEELHNRLSAVMVGMARPYEIIYVENRSTDNTIQKLKSLTNATVLVMRLPLDKGRTTQSVALDAGIKEAKGKLIVTMDSDLQNPPEEIPKLIEKLEREDLDVVSGWRQKRKDNFIIRYLSKLGSVVRKSILNPGVHDLGCTLKVYRAECFEGLSINGEMHRYLVAMLKWRGFRIGELPVAHSARTSGTSSYNWWKMFRGFADMWLIWFWKKYADRPLHLFGVWGMLLALLGVLSLGVLVVLRAFEMISLGNSILPLLSALMIIMGTQLFIFGIMMDLLIKQYYATSGEPLYTLREKLYL